MTLVTLLSKEVKSKPGFDFIRRGVTRNQASIHPTGRSHVAHHQKIQISFQILESRLRWLIGVFKFLVKKH